MSSRMSGASSSLAKEAYCVSFSRQDNLGRPPSQGAEVGEATEDLDFSDYVEVFRGGSLLRFLVAVFPTPLPLTKGVVWARGDTTGQGQSFLQTTAGSFLERANQLDKRGQTDAALDLIYDQVDALLRSGALARIDALLSGTDVRSLSPDVLLGLLTATLPARTKLRSRKAFFKKVETFLKSREDWENDLLTGLES